MQDLGCLASLAYKNKGFVLGEVTTELLIHYSLEPLKLLAHIDWLHAQYITNTASPLYYKQLHLSVF